MGNKDQILELLENGAEIPSKTIGLLSLYAAGLIRSNKKILTLSSEETEFFEKATQNPGYAHLHSEILFSAFYNLANTDLTDKFETKFSELTKSL